MEPATFFLISVLHFGVPNPPPAGARCVDAIASLKAQKLEIVLTLGDNTGQVGLFMESKSTKNPAEALVVCSNGMGQED